MSKLHIDVQPARRASISIDCPLDIIDEGSDISRYVGVKGSVAAEAAGKVPSVEAASHFASNATASTHSTRDADLLHSCLGCKSAV